MAWTYRMGPRYGRQRWFSHRLRKDVLDVWHDLGSLRLAVEVRDALHRRNAPCLGIQTPPKRIEQALVLFLYRRESIGADL
jgi:hypothetical protein